MEIYVSVDIEADGTIPGPYSMSSFGMIAVGLADQGNLIKIEGTPPSFYAELKPISDDFVPAAAAVAGLDRNDLIENGLDPEVAMKNAAAWVNKLAVTYNARPVFVAWPLSFDWMWMYWYFMQYNGSSPFGHSSALDIKTYWGTKMGLEIRKVGKRGLPAAVRSKSPHTHNALDDAREQGETFWNMLHYEVPLND